MKGILRSFIKVTGTSGIWLAALGLAFSACDREQKVNARTKSADLNLAPFEVTGTLGVNASTNARAHKLHIKYLKDLPNGFKPSIKVTIKDSSGKVGYEGTQKGADLDWPLGIDGAEGVYTLNVEAEPDPAAPQLDTKHPWTSQFELDMTQPEIVLSSSIAVGAETGLRQLASAVTVRQEAGASCAEAVLKADAGKEQKLELEASAESAIGLPNKADHTYQLKPFTIPDDFRAPFVLSVRCKDRAGNEGEALQPVNLVPLKYAFTADVKAEKGSPVGSTATAAFVRPGSIGLSFHLVDTQTKKDLTAKAVQWEKPFLWLYVTEFAPKTADSLRNADAPLFSQGFENEAAVTLPGDYVGAKTVYASLVRRDSASGKDALIGTVPLSLYVDDEGPSLTWLSTPRFDPAVEGQSLSLLAQVKSEGAPFAEALAAEYSTDGKTWQKLDLKEDKLVESSAGVEKHQLSFVYPLKKEQPLRVRVRAQDRAKNETISDVSPSVVGRPDLVFATAKADRDGCKANGTTDPGSKFAPQLASTGLCRLKNADGTLSDTLYMQILLRNAGAVPISFYPNSSITGVLGFEVLADGTAVNDVDQGLGQSESEFTFDQVENHLFLLPVTKDWLSANKIELKFDIEVNNLSANSIANSCYKPDAYPSFVAQDVANGTALTETEFACDPAGKLMLP